MNEIVKTSKSAPLFNPEEMDIIKNQIAKGASDLELKYFLELCKRTGLNPFTRQIYLIERRVWNQRTGQFDKAMVPQTSIDGFRSIAEDSEKYAGQQGPYWCGPDAEWRDVWVRDDFPVAARVGVLRVGFTEPLWAVAKFKTYCQMKDNRPIKSWATMPDLMIAKCAEALALRRAFPQKLGGLYTGDEMGQVLEMEQQTNPVNEGTGIQHITVNAGDKIIEYAKPSQIADEMAAASAEPGKPETPVSAQAWRRFAEQAVAHARAGGSFSPEQQEKMSRMKRERPEQWQKMADAIADAQMSKGGSKEPKEPPQPNPGDDPDAYLVWLIDQTSKYDKKKDLTDFFDIQRPLWKNEKCFPPDIDEWEELFRKREKELT